MVTTVLFYLSIPLITALIGWITNVVAVRLIFRPREQVKVGPLLFQGILPKYQHKFAHALAAMSTQELMNTRELFQKIEPDKVQEILANTLNDLSRDYVKIALDEASPRLWNLVPASTRDAVIEGVRHETYQTVSEIFQDLDSNIEKHFDLYQFIVEKLTGENVSMMEKLFYRVSYDQLKFIERAGAYFGLAIGALQILLWSLFQQWYLLPLVGGTVGLITNWLAIRMCFEPHEPKKFLFFTYQGMIPRRQKEISRLFGEQAAEEVLRPEFIVENILSGESGDRITHLIANKIDAVVDEKMGLFKPMGMILVGDKFARVKQKIVKRAISSFPQIAEELQYYFKSAMSVSELLEERLTSLEKNKFEQILRGLFREDEILLIIYGGILGLVIGSLQTIFLLLTH